MQKNFFKSLTFAVLLTVGLALTASAAVPPPPVNQLIGIPDTVFDNLQEADCRVCHGPTPPPGVADLIDTTYLPDRHHMLLGTAVHPNTAAPTEDADGDGVADATYGCLNCHGLEGATGALTFTIFRDCTACHAQQPGQATVHHATAEAQAGDCQACHGSLVDNGLIETPTWIPSYPVSLITPWPSDKPNSGPNGEGNCNFCHAPSTARPGMGGEPGIDPDSGVVVFSNADTHHSTGFLLDSSKCQWCHPVNASGFPITSPSAQSIRACQTCHGIPSLHNIQFDNDGDGIVPGTEDPWFGHIGANSDCQGCHGFSITSAAFGGAPVAAITPQIDAMTKYVVAAGVATTVEMVGQNFLNSVDSIDYSCTVVLTDADGNTVELTPEMIEAAKMQFTVPGYLKAGNYKVVAKKLDKISNPEVLVVKAEISIESAAINADGTITIKGAGFGMAPPMAEGLGVFVDGAAADVVTWSNDSILVNVPGAMAGQTCEVASTYTVSAQLTGAAQPPVIDDGDNKGKGKGKQGQKDKKKSMKMERVKSDRG